MTAALVALLQHFRAAFRQERVFWQVMVLLVGEVLTLERHTVTQILVTLGWVDRDWSAWYRIVRKRRLPHACLAYQMLQAVLEHVADDELFVVGDKTTTPRSSQKMEGMGWLPNPQGAPFQRGLRLAQRWFHLAWLTPPEEGYSRAISLLWLPAFTPKAQCRRPVRSEVQAARVALYTLWRALRQLAGARCGCCLWGMGAGHVTTHGVSACGWAADLSGRGQCPDGLFEVSPAS